jgi:hypothetical protein
MAHSNGVHTPDERLGREGVLKTGGLDAIAVEVRVLQLSDCLLDRLHIAHNIAGVG